MKRWICLLLVLSIGAACMGCFDDTNSESTPSESGTEATEPFLSEAEKAELRNYFRDLARNFTVGADGTTVTVSAPDFIALIPLLPEGINPDMVTAEQWRAIAEENPELVKEYVLTVDTAREADVFKALYDTVMLELFIAVVGEMDLDFSDPATRGEAAQ